MPPRPRMPQPRGMGGRMMQGPAPYQRQMMGRGGAQTSNGGGILSKLLGGGKGGDTNVQRGAAMLGSSSSRNAATGGGILKTLTNPASINGLLANSQKFLQTASQVGPMISQYGPMVRNIPAMWKLYRGLTSSSDSSTDKSAGTNKVKNTKTTQEATGTSNETAEPTAVPGVEETPARGPQDSGVSVPRMYI